MASLVVGVNAPPRLFRPLPSVVYLYRSETAEGTNPSVLDLVGKQPNTEFVPRISLRWRWITPRYKVTK